MDGRTHMTVEALIGPFLKLPALFYLLFNDLCMNGRTKIVSLFTSKKNCFVEFKRFECISTGGKLFFTRGKASVLDRSNWG